MDGHIGVKIAAVAEGEADFDRVLGDLKADLSELDGQLQASLAQWSGAAQQAYHHAHAEWQAAVADMTRILAWLRSVLGTAHQNYASAHGTNLRIWQGGR